MSMSMSMLSPMVTSTMLNHWRMHYYRMPWCVSHISTHSFDLNRRLLYLDYEPFLVPGSRRGFRTRPSVGMGADPVSPAPTKKILGSIFSRHSEPDGNSIGDLQQERLKQLLQNDLFLSAKDQQKLRMAFAEGYMSATNPKKEKSSKWRFLTIARDVLSFIVILVVLFSFMSEFTGSAGPFRRVLIGGGNEVMPEEITVSFDDVKGVAEAKQELQEVVAFLRNPDKFSSLGGKLPKGVLLVGPPGTGKTLLARAVAGEAGVPFFHASGPEFDEVFVGQGARRVRDLFSNAKVKAPCVIFIDEIDSVGQKRTNSFAHPYANQTINQLLSEMDGFKQNEGVVVIGATNRKEDLDKALLRPGRFDVEVSVPPPDLKGRQELFQYYLSKITCGKDMCIDVLARQTTGFTGADIENMINQAALRAAIDGYNAVNMSHMEYSRDKLMMGPERKNRIPDEEANRITAFHEGGHTLVTHFTKEATPLHKVTIVPRGQSLGHTAFLLEESYHTTKSQLLALMDVAMGGRAAEEIIYGADHVTSGAFDDLKKATAIATQMVKMYGMSDKVGVRTFIETNDERDLSAATTDIIDQEIKKLLQDSYERAKNLLVLHSNELKLLADALLKYETLDADDVVRVISGKEPKGQQ